MYSTEAKFISPVTSILLFENKYHLIPVFEIMADSLVCLFVGIVVFVTAINAQNPSCPTNPSGIYCVCYTENAGYRIQCDTDFYANTTPEKVRDALVYYQSYGPVVSFYVMGITQMYFNYVPDNFLAGIQIPNVRFQCSHSNYVYGNLLLFSVNAFTNESGVCGLTGNVTFSDCNLRQFDTATLKNCNQLKNLAFMNSHVETLTNIPTMESLKNFTVYSPRQWSGATQRGLSRMTLAPGASLPQLTYLDLTGNSLKDDSIEFVSQLTAIEEIRLEGNNFTAVPNLTNSFYLHTFSMSFNSTETSISILLPNPRTQLRSLKATFNSNYRAIHDVASLEGMFVKDVINFNINMTKFSEEVFLAPLQTNGLTINLDPNSKFVCGCSISWLVRDNPAHLTHVNNGTCSDGRPFQSIPVEEVSCCSNESLLLRIDRLQKENDNLKAMRSSKCRRESPPSLPAKAQTV